MNRSNLLSLTRRQLLLTAAGAVATSVVGSLTTQAGLAQTLAPNPNAPRGFVRQTVTVNDNGAKLDRTFLAHVPPSPISPAPLPAVIVFHGRGQDGERMVQHWESMLGQFVIVCPDALVDPILNATLWNVARPGDVAVPTTDLAFVEALLAWLAATGRVDMQRVYASGFSSGAVMTWQLTLLNQFVNRFRGFAPVSHTMNTGQLALSDTAARATPKPLAYAHGDADFNWSQVLLDQQQPTPPDMVEMWINRNRTLEASPPVVYSCGTTFGPIQEPKLDPLGVEQLYRPDPGAPGSAAICFLRVLGGSHGWPLTGADPTGRRLITHDLDWTKRVVAFWNTYAGMGLPTVADWRKC